MTTKHVCKVIQTLDMFRHFGALHCWYRFRFGRTLLFIDRPHSPYAYYVSSFLQLSHHSMYLFFVFTGTRAHVRRFQCHASGDQDRIRRERCGRGPRRRWLAFLPVRPGWKSPRHVSLGRSRADYVDFHAERTAEAVDETGVVFILVRYIHPQPERSHTVRIHSK